MTIFTELSLLATASRWIIAYSGGVDSRVLLQLSVKYADNKPLLAVHIHHGISVHADAWAQHCNTVCTNLGVKFYAVKVEVGDADGNSLEAAAREARYAALATFVQPGDALLIAHHQDDQAETLLLQLLRGSGIKGLASMPTVSRFSQGYLVRPLLQTSRADIILYAQKHKLTWLEDDSNADQRFDRNFLRHTVLPLLKNRWPSVDAILARTARYCVEADTLSTKIGREDCRLASRVKPLNLPPFLYTGIISRLAIAPLLALPVIRVINTLRTWLYDLRIAKQHLVTEKTLQHIYRDILASRHDAVPLMMLGRFMLRRFQNELIISHTLANFDCQKIYAWNLCSDLVLPIGKLTPHLVKNINPSAGKFTVRFRQGGERFKPADYSHTRSVKKLLQRWAVPPWLRGRIPLLYCDAKLVAILGYTHHVQ